MKKDLNEIAAVEKAISKKYGSETITNPSQPGMMQRKKSIEQVKIAKEDDSSKRALK